jgi:tetratricopeptide (TPR) repeat protein
MIPLQELLATTSASPIYNEGTRTGVFYAQSWALFHYLMTDGDRRAKFSRFLQLLGTQKSADEAFETAFAMKYADVEAELRKYVNRNMFNYTRYSLEQLPVPEPPKPEPMAHGDVLFALGHLLTRADYANSAISEQFLRAALVENPQNAAAHADLGRLHEVAGRRADADAAYRTAVELGSRDAGVYLSAAISLLQRFVGKSSDEIPAAELTRARSLFQRSTELDPKRAVAWAGLGATYLSEADPAPGIAALEKSLQLAPGDEQAAFYLLQLYASVGRRDDAVRLFDTTLARSANAEMVAHGREVLFFADLHELESLASDGKVKEASALANALLLRVTDESLKQHLTEFLQNVQRQAAAERINQAITYANAGKNADALRVLDEVLPEITDPAMLAEAKKFRAEVAARVGKRK